MSARRAVGKSELASEADRATRLLEGKVVKRIWRHQQEEVTVTFTDGTHLHIVAEKGGTQELSISGGPDMDA